MAFFSLQSASFEGLWVMGVCNCKIILRKILGPELLTYDEILTILAEVFYS